MTLVIFNRFKFAVKSSHVLIVNIKKDYGNVYLYKDLDQSPPYEYNNSNHYLRIKIKNLPTNAKVEFQHKFFDGKWKAMGHKKITKLIKKNGEHIFQSKSLINIDENVKKEQVGIYISGEICEIKNVIISDIYYGEIWNFKELFCCKKYGKTIMYRRKK